MVQKHEPKRRGRPRAYDPDTALEQARDAFWRAGFSGTSLDDLSAATAMNRPSLYGAFGDKKALYLKAIERYRQGSRAWLKGVLGSDQPLAEALDDIYSHALGVYLPRDGSPARGCFMIGTAATEAAHDAEIRAALADGLGELDDVFAARFRREQAQGNVTRDIDAATLGRLAASVIHTLSVRTRAGESRAVLERLIDGAIRLLCADKRAKKRR